MLKSAFKTVTILATIAIVATAAHAVPGSFAVQGVLRDGSGTLQSAAVLITVKIYNDQTLSDPANLLGTPLVAQSTMATNGLFTVDVPMDGALQAQLATTALPWLELTAGGDVFPRQPVSSEIYALISHNAEQLGGHDASEYLLATTATTTYQPLLKSNCTPGKYIQAIDAAGTVTCANDANSGGTVTNVTSASSALTVTTGTTTPSLTVNGANITGLDGANITAGTLPKTALVANALNHAHGLVITSGNDQKTVSFTSLNQVAGNCSGCPAGQQIISGSCYQDDSAGGKLVLTSYTITSNVFWCCSWKNTSSGAASGSVSANCLAVTATTP